MAIHIHVMWLTQRAKAYGEQGGLITNILLFPNVVELLI